MFNFFKQRRRQRRRSQPFPPSWLNIINKNVPNYDRLPQADQLELQGHIRIFLVQKVYEGYGGLELTDEIKVTIAAQACLLLLRRETNYYPRLITILVYPHAYVAKSIEPIGGEIVQEGETLRPAGNPDPGGAGSARVRCIQTHPARMLLGRLVAQAHVHDSTKIGWDSYCLSRYSINRLRSLST